MYHDEEEILNEVTKPEVVITRNWPAVTAKP